MKLPVISGKEAASLVDSCEFRTTDIAAEIRLYFNLYHVIKIKIHNCHGGLVNTLARRSHICIC